MKSNKEQIEAAAEKKFVTPHEAKRHDANTATRPDAKQEKPAKKRRNASKGKLGSLLGHSVVSVIRCMGRNGWDFSQAQAALTNAGITAAEHTIRIGLKRGRDGQKRIAPLSKKELASLKATASTQVAG